MLYTHIRPLAFLLSDRVGSIVRLPNILAVGSTTTPRPAATLLMSLLRMGAPGADDDHDDGLKAECLTPTRPTMEGGSPESSAKMPDPWVGCQIITTTLVEP